MPYIHVHARYLREVRRMLAEYEYGNVVTADLGSKGKVTGVITKIRAKDSDKRRFRVECEDAAASSGRGGGRVGGSGGGGSRQY